MVLIFYHTGVSNLIFKRSYREIFGRPSPTCLDILLRIAMLRNYLRIIFRNIRKQPNPSVLTS